MDDSGDIIPGNDSSISHEPAEFISPGSARQLDVSGTSDSERLTHEPRNPESENSRSLGIDISK